MWSLALFLEASITLGPPVQKRSEMSCGGGPDGEVGDVGMRLSPQLSPWTAFCVPMPWGIQQGRKAF